MPDVWVVNSSPLICLEKIGQTELLARLATVLVPAGVITEVAQGPKPLASSRLGEHRVVSVQAFTHWSPPGIWALAKARS